MTSPDSDFIAEVAFFPVQVEDPVWIWPRVVVTVRPAAWDAGHSA